ncbi:MAG: caspase family protein [Deltaproteobacteria bacterium]|nr:caspase family protein [Deltaproteobacteria bacterium]
MRQIFILIALLMLLPVTAAAEDSRSYHAYGLLIGSNRAGSGQSRLQYAHRDARRMAGALQDVGGFKSNDLDVLLDPDKWQVQQALDRFEQELKAHAERGEKTMFVFYYSGHARSTGLNLGSDIYPLWELKKRLKKLSSTVTIVLLDACQTGAISNVKGVQPTSDFSYNSVDNLNVSGMAVIASSSGSELSQESEKLKGSYFSHHFTVGLRGAADNDKNGVVTLAEAYNYAYHRTLSTTAQTAVGKQHATMEMNFKGKGDMPISWPGDFTTNLWIPESVEGDILLTHVQSQTVVAEIRKVKGQEYVVAIPPGRYEGFVRLAGKRAARCDMQIGSGVKNVMKLNGCEFFTLQNEQAKGREVVYSVAKPEIPRRREYIMAEFHVGYFGAGASPYTRRLEDFDYNGLDSSRQFGGALGIVASPFPYLSVGFTAATMDHRNGTSNLTSLEKTVSWSSWRVGGFLRGNLIHGRALFVPYVQFGGGYAKAQFHLDVDNSYGSTQTDESFSGAYVSGGGGVQMNVLRWFGLTLLHVEYTWAQLVEMTVAPLDEKHQNGGVSIFTGVRFGY